jgi:hypothetical protein
MGNRLGRKALTGQDGCRQQATVIVTEHASGETDLSEFVRLSESLWHELE